MKVLKSIGFAIVMGTVGALSAALCVGVFFGVVAGIGWLCELCIKEPYRGFAFVLGMIWVLCIGSAFFHELEKEKS